MFWFESIFWVPIFASHLKDWKQVFFLFNVTVLINITEMHWKHRWQTFNSLFKKDHVDAENPFVRKDRQSRTRKKIDFEFDSSNVQFHADNWSTANWELRLAKMLYFNVVHLCVFSCTACVKYISVFDKMFCEEDETWKYWSTNGKRCLSDTESNPFTAKNQTLRHYRAAWSNVF